MKNYRVGYAAGGVIKKVIQGGKKISKKISDAARKQDTADRIKVFEHAGPHEGEVITKRILGKGTKKGDRTKAAVKDAVAAKPWAGKPHAEGGRIGRAAGGWTRVIPQKKLKKLDFPGDRTGKPHSSREGRRDSWVRGARRAVESAKKIKEKMKPKRREGREAPKAGPQAPSRPKKTWPPKHSDLLQRYPKMPQPHKSPGDKPYIPEPKYTPGETKYRPLAAKGGRIGKAKGGKADKNWIQKATKGMVKTKPCTGRKFGSKSCPPGSRRYNLAKTFKKMGRERKAKG